MTRGLLALAAAALLAGCGGGGHATAKAPTHPKCPGWPDPQTTFSTFKSGMSDGSLSAAQSDAVLQKLSTQLSALDASDDVGVRAAASAGAQDATKLDAALTSGDNSSVTTAADDLRVRMDALSTNCP